MSEVEKGVNVARLVKPKFLSLVGVPANQVAFKVIRDDNGEKVMAAPHIQRKRKARRSDQIIALEFDASMSDEDIASVMSEWGVSEYTIETYDHENDKRKVVRCADAGDAPTMQIRMDDSTVVTVLKPISNPPVDAQKPHVAVARMEFAADYFPSLDDISEWCSRNSVDFSNLEPQNEAQQTVVCRNIEVEKDAETHRIEVDPGVRFVVVRAEESDVPEPFIMVVNDAAYGNWGWGQLDFAAAMADVEYSELTEQAIYKLRNVLDRILFYSELPLDVRKTLVSRATGQFADFVSALMDALPARVVIANRSALEKESSMSKPNQKEGTDTARSDAAKAAQAATAKAEEDETQRADAQAAEGDPAAAAEGEGGTEGGDDAGEVSRADVAKMIDAAVGGLSTQISDLAAKLDGTKPAEGAPAQRNDKEGEGEGEGETEAQVVLRSIQELTTAVKAVHERVETLEGSTTVRADGDDTAQTDKRKDVFAGMFSRGQKAN